MKSMIKECEYRGYKFDIEVRLNTRVEKKIDGERWHTVITTIMDIANYCEKEEVKDEFLELFVFEAEKSAKKCIDEKEDGKKPIHQRLSALGFK